MVWILFCRDREGRMMWRERWEACKDWALISWWALVLATEWVVAWVAERLPKRG